MRETAGKMVLLAALLLAASSAVSQVQFWEQLNPPFNVGKVSDILPGPGDTVFVGLVDLPSGNVYRSTNRGTDWTQFGNLNLAAYSLARHPNGDIYVGSDFRVYKTSDNGQTWVATAPVSVGAIGGIGVSISNTGAVFASSGAALSRSTDNGNSWSVIMRTYTVHGNTTVLLGSRIALAPNGLMVVGTLSDYPNGVIKLFRSTNYGSTWISLPFPDSAGPPISVSDIFLNSTGDIFVEALGLGTTGSGVYRTTDNGQHWDQLSLPAGEQLRILAINRRRDIIANGRYLSQDNGDSWSRLPGFPPNGVATKLKFDSLGYAYAVFSSPTVNLFRSTCTSIPFGGVPQPRSPANGSVDELPTLVLSWSPTEGFQDYELQVATDSIFSNIVFSDLVMADTSKQMGLFHGTSYYWRVRGTNECGFGGEYSPIWHFTTAAGVPPFPNWRVYTRYNSGLPSNYITAIAIDSSHIKWLGTDLGVTQYDGSTTSFTASNSGFPGVAAASIAVDRSNKKWIATYYSGLARFDGSEWKVYNPLNSGLPSYNARTIAIEGHDTVWIGTNAGLAKFDGSNWIAYNKLNSGLPDDYVTAVVIDSAGSKWVGTQLGGLAEFDGVNWTIYNTSNSGIPSNGILALCVDGIGRKWVATNTGLARFDGLGWAVYNTFNSGLPNNEVRAVLADQDNIWGGTSGGLAKFDGSAWTIFSSSNSGLPNDNVTCLPLDSFGNRWIGTLGGLAVYKLDGPVLPPRLASPVNRAVDQPTNLALHWNAPEGSPTGSPPSSGSPYWVQLSTDSLFSTLIINDSTISGTSLPLSGLANSTRYYWRVRNRLTNTWGPFSVTWQFTTILAPPAPPLLQSPAESAVGQPTSLTMQWRRSATAESYRLQVATDTAFVNLVIDDSTLVDTSHTVSNLQPLTWYHWRVSAKNIAGTSTYSQRWRFETMGVPTQVALVSPPNNASNVKSPVALAWHPAATAETYHLQLATDSSFTLGIVLNDSLIVDTARTADSLTNSSKYFWRVRAKNVVGSGAYSDVWRFTTVLTYATGIEGLPREFALKQNYPNPFNPSTTIQYDVPTSSHVLLKVYNLLGQAVGTLVDEAKQPGRYAATWECRNLPTGVYFYRMQASEFVQTKKLILLR